MLLIVFSVVYATLLWWFSTGIIFYLNGRPVRTFRWSLSGATLVLLGAIYGLWYSASQVTVSSVWLAFTCGLLIWGWHTMSYYMGIVTGPRQDRCPEDCQGWRRFLFGVATSAYHELAILATAGLLLWLTWGQPNQFGLWTFLLLWTMHVSAKLNVFLGVRNLNVEFIPDRLSYLTSYFRERPMNLLFPFSVTAGTILSVWMLQQAGSNGMTTPAGTGWLLLTTLSALAVIEHWFMILPLRAEALWRWSLPKHGRSQDGEPIVDGSSAGHRQQSTPGDEPMKLSRSTSARA